MNLISNTCLSAAIQKLCLKQKFTNPFCWSWIEPKSFLYLIENYKNINYDKFELIEKEHKYSIKIDNKILVEYNHYKYKQDQIELLVKNGDTYWNKIDKYIIERYKERLIRMKKIIDEKPIFIVGTSNPDRYYSKEDIIKVCNACKGKYKLIVANNIDLSSDFPDVKFIITKPNAIHITDYAKQIFPEIEEFIKG